MFELRLKLIGSLCVPIYQKDLLVSSIICETELFDDGKNEWFKCCITHVLSYRLNLQADRAWQGFNGELVTKILDTASDEDAIEKLAAACSIEDKHWSWSKKGIVLDSDQYEWFYLLCGEEVEGICVIYHPEPSRIDEEEIFYVDFVAIHPRNRKNPFFEKGLKGVGTSLLKIALNHSVEFLGYRPGFCLHSLPGAESYYERIGMTSFGRDVKKDNLTYFEMDSANSASFL